MLMRNMEKERGWCRVAGKKRAEENECEGYKSQRDIEMHEWCYEREKEDVRETAPQKKDEELKVQQTRHRQCHA